MKTYFATFIRHSSYLPNLLASLLFGGLAVLYYLPALGWLPRGIHEWAQADRLALAISFYDHGLDFFRPQTLNLGSIDGVVGVEFPLAAYLAALAAKLTGRGSIVYWFRLLNIGAAFAGCYFLFRLVFERCRNFAAAVLPGIFLATSPVFAYYTGNFLPDPAGASLVLVASYYLLRFGQQHKFSSLAAAIGWYTLATLIKTSAGIYPVAAISLVLLWTYLQPEVLGWRQRLSFLLLSAGGATLIVGYALYTAYLNRTYHSGIFLAQLVPIENEEQYRDVLTRVRDVWWVEYFTRAHIFVLEASLLVCALSIWRIVRTEWLWASTLALAVVGGSLFFKLMGRQLINHDYYVLAPYWPGLALLVGLAATQLASWRLSAGQWQSTWRIAQYTLPTLAGLGLLLLGLPSYRARTSEPYRQFSEHYSYRWMQGGAAVLAKAQIPTTANLLVLGEDAPNLSLIYFDRRGITWAPDLKQLHPEELTTTMSNYGLQYLLMRREVFEQLPPMLDYFRAFLRTDRYVLLTPTTPTAP